MQGNGLVRCRDQRILFCCSIMEVFLATKSSNGLITIYWETMWQFYLIQVVAEDFLLTIPKTSSWNFLSLKIGLRFFRWRLSAEIPNFGVLLSSRCALFTTTKVFLVSLKHLPIVFQTRRMTSFLVNCEWSRTALTLFTMFSWKYQQQ